MAAAACAATHVMRLVVPQLKISPTALLLPMAAAIMAALSAACVRLTSCEPSPGTSTGRPPATRSEATTQRRAAVPQAVPQAVPLAVPRRGSGVRVGVRVGGGCSRHARSKRGAR